ncbi:YqiJ family protein [Acidovorax sp.]|uniref:YqiJ family protein n=1 Tax=Acidovorax sp. TaxID=1872122 RepID=UPI002ACD75AC|nr:YqiJ family protein [Acidovorax sp.]MDZ7861504.1 YqiJ family protein [Acidovorax sp.]
MITSLFTAPETWPFGVAFALIVGIALIEGLGMLVSLSPSNWLDDLLPDIDGDTGLDRVLGWLYIGKVPSLVLLVLFLTGYAIFGYSLQKVAHGLLGGYLPVWLAGLVAVAPGMATVRSLGALIAHIIPRDETSAVSEMSLIGRAGIVSAGAARRGLAAQARVRDAHGRTHYLMVEPDVDDEVFDEGAQILIVRKAGAFYRCIANPHPGLM